MRLPAIGVVAISMTVGACGPAAGGSDGVPAWPDSLPPASAFGAPRGWEPVRTILHVHSVFSHDACDGEPQDSTGTLNAGCRERFRAALCQARVDAAFLTEHDRYLVRADDVETALALGDDETRVRREGRVVAGRLPCGTLLFPGAENTLMPIGFDSLPGGNEEARRAFYDAHSPDAAATFRRWGAFVLLSHTEDTPASRISELGPDAIEVYNPHANFAPKHREAQGMSRLGAIVDLVPFLLRTTPAHPDLALAAIFQPNDTALERWDRLLATRMIYGFGGSDAHENSVPWSFSDGERGDSYARMVPWVTNVVLIDGAADRATAIEEALRAGHFYAVVEAWGTPSGFDFRIEGPHGVSEMGTTLALRPGLTAVVETPEVADLWNGAGVPLVTSRLYRIQPSGARALVAEGTGRLDAPLDQIGAYRVEVSITPHHLAPYLGRHAGVLTREMAWVYSNPIRVVETPVFDRSPGKP